MLGGLMRRRWARPFPYGRRLLGGAMSLMWTAGGLMGVLTVVLPHRNDLVVSVIATVSVAALAVGVSTWLARDLLGVGTLAGITAVGTAAITVTVAAGGGEATSVSFSFLYTWIVVYAVMFFPPVLAGLEIALAVAAYAAVYLYLGTFTIAEPMFLGGVITVTGTVVIALSHAREHAEIDALTHVGNRRALDRQLRLAMKRAQDASAHLAVAMIDVDHFKEINDSLGHDAGDRILEQLAQRWLGQLRTQDMLARFGGDEFVVILPGCSTYEAFSIMDRLRQSAGPMATCSVGVAARRSGDNMSTLLSRADAALYEAKRLGRDRTVAAEDAGAAA